MLNASTKGEGDRKVIARVLRETGFAKVPGFVRTPRCQRLELLESEPGPAVILRAEPEQPIPRRDGHLQVGLELRDRLLQREILIALRLQLRPAIAQHQQDRPQQIRLGPMRQVLVDDLQPIQFRDARHELIPDERQEMQRRDENMLSVVWSENPLRPSDNQ